MVIKFDQAIKKLFQSVTNRTIVNFLNFSFGTKIDQDDKVGVVTNAEYIDELFYSKFYPDMVITDKTKAKYHIEIQASNDKLMSFRMFRYGLAIADDLKYKKNEDEIILRFPSQLVIYFNENADVKERPLRIIFEDLDYLYKYKTLKIWELTKEELEEHELYIHLALVVANRKRYESKNIDKITRDYEEIYRIASKNQNENELDIILHTIDYIYESLLDEVIDEKEKRKEISKVSEAIRMRPWKEQKEEYMETIRKEAIAKGLEEGRQRGLKEGRQEGIEKTKKDFVSNMIREGLDYETIKKIAQVSFAEYEELKSKLST